MTDTQPILNAPKVVVWVAAVTVGVHVLMVLLQTAWINQPELVALIRIKLGFIPARYILPGEIAADPLAVILSPLTHALLHGGWAHLLMNMAFLMAFGSAVARRTGGARFLVLYATGAIAGVFSVFGMSPESVALVIGASGAVSALTGAIVRIAITPAPNTAPPPPPFHNRRTAVGFLIVFVTLNLLSAVVPSLIGIHERIAWEAHLGGFLAGYLLMPIFDTPIGED